jgi:hypothetical protein
VTLDDVPVDWFHLGYLLLLDGMDQPDGRFGSRRSILAGASGIVFGRNVFQASDPVAFLLAAQRAVHGPELPPRSM